MKRKFSLGRIVATPAALAALAASRQLPADLLARHASGEWGEICSEDKLLNDEALLDGSRILSSYRLVNNETLWIITEADRSSTCILLPDDY